MPSSTKAGERELLEQAAHDLRNPLSVVRASLEWLEVELVDRDDALDAVRDARLAADRLLEIADDLDSLARLRSEGGDPGLQAHVLLVPLVASVVASASSANLGRRGITVVSTANTPLEICG